MAIGYGIAQPKGDSRKRVKGRKDRAEAKQKHMVRMLCVSRDGDCRAQRLPDDIAVSRDYWDDFKWPCDGVSEWAHMHVKRRSKTRGMAPEVRHTTEASVMLCHQHHDQYDGRQKPRLFITALTKRGADGPLKFRRAK